MDDNDESNSPDITDRPRFLLRRYDSVSTSSGSCRSSFGSSGSHNKSPQTQNDVTPWRKRTNTWGTSERKSPNRQNDTTTRRTRTNTWTYNETERNIDGSSQNQNNGKVRGRSNGIICDDAEIDICGDKCVFCDTLVHERQYYLWNSKYTKSSLCTRCSDDVDGMRYISYWGTPSYEIGSWRKRYRTGRSVDIDLTPLLEVLERIDRIDTSMYGRKSTKSVDNSHENSKNYKNNSEDTKLTSIRDPDEMAARRRRRLENRKALEACKDTDQTISTNKHSNNKEVSVNNAECTSTGTLDKIDKSNDNLKTNIGYIASEVTNKTEEIDVIEPLNIRIVVEEISGDTKISNDYHAADRSTVVDHDDTLKAHNGKDMLSAENIAKYRKERRKSNYEDFLAGLEPFSPLQRRSTAADDLTVYNDEKENGNNIKEYKKIKDINVSVKNKTNTSETRSESKDSHLSCNRSNRNDLDKRADIQIQKRHKMHKHSKASHILNNQHEVNAVQSYEHTELTLQNGKETHSPSSSQRRRLRKLQHTRTIFAHDSSSDDCSSKQEEFSEIKRKFENLSTGNALQNENRLLQKQSTDISIGNFRDWYLQNADRRNVVSSDENNKDWRNNDTVLFSSIGSDIESLEEKDTIFIDKIEQRAISANGATKISNSISSDENLNQSKVSDNLQDVTGVTIEKAYRHLNENDCNQINDGSGKDIPMKNKLGLDIFKCSESSPESNDESLSSSDITESQNDICMEVVGNKGFLNESSLRIESVSPEPFNSFNHENKETAATEREKKYKQNEKYIEHEDPNIERIKRKLSRKPKYEDENSDKEELHDQILELNGSDEEEVELGWRTRGYSTDFYMSRQSVTGGEIIDRYKRAISNRRSRNHSRQNSRKSSKNISMTSMVDQVMTHQEPVLSHSAPITRSNTKRQLSPDLNKNTERSDRLQQHSNKAIGSSGVSAADLKQALDRAAHCSKRMSQRIKSQLNPSFSGDSSS